MVKHFDDAARKYMKEFKLTPKKSYIIDIGSNDGVALKPFQKLNFRKILGVEPAKNLAKLANKQKIKTLNAFSCRIGTLSSSKIEAISFKF